MTQGHLYLCKDECIVMYLKDNPEDETLFYAIIIEPLDEGFERGYFCKEWKKSSFRPYNGKVELINQY